MGRRIVALSIVQAAAVRDAPDGPGSAQRPGRATDGAACAVPADVRLKVGGAAVGVAEEPVAGRIAPNATAGGGPLVE